MRSAWVIAGPMAAMLCMIGAPVSACSIVWPGYERITAESDALVIVETTTVSGLSASDSDNPFSPTSIGLAEGRIERTLKGRGFPSPLTFDYWHFDDEKSCGVSFEVEAGQTYYVWLRRTAEHGWHTSYGVSAADVSASDARAIRRYARSNR